jgi:hypothetical protein
MSFELILPIRLVTNASLKLRNANQYPISAFYSRVGLVILQASIHCYGNLEGTPPFQKILSGLVLGVVN